MKHLYLFLGMLMTGHFIQAQTMEEKVMSYIESFLSENKSFISDAELFDTQWATSDQMGNSIISFDSKLKFKRIDDGYQASFNKAKGKWYVHDEYLVLSFNKEKKPMYILKNDDKIVIVDDYQINVLKELLTEASYKDGELKPYSYQEIFTFLNGFTLQK